MRRFARQVHACACGTAFTASRSDAERCFRCRNSHRSKWQRANTKRRADLHRAVREQAFAGYGGQCACCGESRFEFLALDHVEGGGVAERKAGLSTRQIAKRAIDAGFPPKYRVLCHNCNLARGFFGACPHESEAANKEAA